MKQTKNKQLSFKMPGLSKKAEAKAHGTETSRSGKRKTRRPFSPRQTLHVTLRSAKARGTWSLLHKNNCNFIKSHLEKLQKRWNIRVYRYANAGNHLHLLLRAKSRADWQGFIREFSGGVAMKVTGAKKGNQLQRSEAARLPESAKRGFWDGLTYSRLVEWGRDFKSVCRYIGVNTLEAMGIPVRQLVKRGYRLLEASDDGLVMIHAQSQPETRTLLRSGA